MPPTLVMLLSLLFVAAAWFGASTAARSVFRRRHASDDAGRRREIARRIRETARRDDALAAASGVERAPVEPAAPPQPAALPAGRPEPAPPRIRPRSEAADAHWDGDEFEIVRFSAASPAQRRASGDPQADPVYCQLDQFLDHLHDNMREALDQ